MSLDDACPLPFASQAPDDDALASLLARATTVAVVGASPNPEKTSHGVVRWLTEFAHFELSLVNPAAAQAGATIGDLGFAPSLDALGFAPDIVVAFRRSEDIPPVAADAIAAGAGTLWMQLGIVNEAAAADAVAAGLAVVQNRCLKVEYARLRGAIEAARAS